MRKCWDLSTNGTQMSVRFSCSDSSGLLQWCNDAKNSKWRVSIQKHKWALIERKDRIMQQYRTSIRSTFLGKSVQFSIYISCYYCLLRRFETRPLCVFDSGDDMTVIDSMRSGNSKLSSTGLELDSSPVYVLTTPGPEHETSDKVLVVSSRWSIATLNCRAFSSGCSLNATSIASSSISIGKGGPCGLRPRWASSSVSVCSCAGNTEGIDRYDRDSSGGVNSVSSGFDNGSRSGVRSGSKLSIVKLEGLPPHIGSS